MAIESQARAPDKPKLLDEIRSFMIATHLLENGYDIRTVQEL
jgi:site-specific recombinase XerD